MRSTAIVSNSRLGSFWLLLRALVALAILGPGRLVWAAPSAAPLAGTSITNQAEAEFDDPDTGATFRLLSNKVEVQVQPLEAVDVTPDNSVCVPIGAPVVLPHRLTNTGNTASTYRLRLENLGGDGYDVANLAVTYDANGNGRPDSGEPPINDGPLSSLLNGLPLGLAAGDSLNFVVAGTVPVTAAVDQLALLQVTATTVFQGVADSATDTVKVCPGVALQVTKAAVPAEAGPNGEVTFTLTATNRGNLAPAGIPVTVDGAAQKLIILRDIIPANTTFVSSAGPVNVRLLYHRVGDALHAYLSTPPANLKQIDAVAFGVAVWSPVGMTLQTTLKVKINGNASGDITNVARLYFTNPATTAAEDALSNEVLVRVPRVPPTIAYYASGSYLFLAGVSGLGRPLFVQAGAAACNADPTVAETVPISITSTLTGDVERFTGTETAPNSGVFRIMPPVPTRDGRLNPPVRGNGIIETVPKDVLTARLDGCGGVSVTATILIDPFGVVFDSRTNAPVAGARVTLIDVTGAGNGGHPGQPARVLDFDGVTPAPSTVITGADGAFRFPQIAASTYRLLIEPPTSFTFPSRVPPAALPLGRVIDAVGSYGGDFVLTLAITSVQFDVPVDGPPPAGLFLDKQASTRIAEIADFVDYQIKVRNTSGVLLKNVALNDDLPRGFSYQAGSTRRDGKAVADPDGGAGPHLVFKIGDLLVGQELTLFYRVRLGPGTQLGDNANRAVAVGATAFGTSLSNIAQALVKVRAGVFTDRAIIQGKVFVDLNHNRIQDRDEPGILGVRLIIEDGSSATTDSEGKYTIYGVSARSHIVKLDPTTMPAGSRLGLVDNRKLGDAGSALADLKNGELQKVNFAEDSATPDILAEVEARRAKGEVDVPETEQLLKTRLNPDGEPLPVGDPRSLPATGTVGSGTAGAPAFSSIAPHAMGAGLAPSSNRVGAAVPRLEEGASPANPASAIRQPLTADTTPLDVVGAPPPPVRAVPSGDLKETLLALPDLNNDLGFLDLTDGDTLARDQANVRVKGAQGSTFKLRVNGDEVPASRVGTKATLPDKQLEAWEYIGVRLKPGDNRLEVEQIDHAGNARGSRAIRVVVPGELGRLQIVASTVSAPADGHTPVTVRVRLLDASGVPVTARTQITLEAGWSGENGNYANAPRWEVRDLNPLEPGVQRFIEGGQASFRLLAPPDPGDCAVRVSSGILSGTVRVSFLPELRPLIAAGIVDSRLDFHAAHRALGKPQNDGFEDTLRSLAGGADSSTELGGRAAMFLKGRIQGKYLLTMRYDSQRDNDARLFRDIQPDEFYPIYGDASLKGFDAQSTGRLYVRVDRDKTYALYGDYTTGTSDLARTLGQYQRSLTGTKFHGENARYRANFFASRDNSRQVIEELRANGTSGPYLLRTASILSQSEKVELIVRDREQPGVVLQVSPQARFSDYMLDGLSQGILFRRPIPSVDADFNPIFIRVTYEVEQGGPQFLVLGGDLQTRLGDKLQIGGSWIQDQNPVEKFRLHSLNGTYQLGAKTFLTAEWAQTSRLGTGKGNAERVELLHEDSRLRARLFAGRSDPEFDNPASVLSRGREELSARVSYQISKHDRLLAQALRTRDEASGGPRTGAELALERSFANNLHFLVGLRHAHQDAVPGVASGIGSAPIDFTSALARLTAQVPNRPEANVSLEYEQALDDRNKRVLAVGGDYQISERSKVYLRHEIVSSFSGRFGLTEHQNQDQHRTVVGIDTDYMKNGHLFSEYRLGDAISAREAQAAFGLRNQWSLGRGVRLQTSLERVHSFGDDESNATLATAQEDSTAAAIALELVGNARWKATASLEGRRGSNTDSLLSTAGAAYKAGRDWTFLGRNVYSTTRTHSGASNGGVATGPRTQERLQMGLAFRQTTVDKWNALAKYEYRLDNGADNFNSLGTGTTAFNSQMKRRVHILSADANYQPRTSLYLRAHYAWKMLKDNSGGLPTSVTAQLLSGRATYEVNRRWDVSLIGSTLWSGTGGRQYGAGVEISYVMMRNLLLSAGYNLFGFEDDDLVGEGYTQRGLYFRLRFKFDEDLFGLPRPGLVETPATVESATPDAASTPAIVPAPGATTTPATPQPGVGFQPIGPEGQQPSDSGAVAGPQARE